MNTELREIHERLRARAANVSTSHFARIADAAAQRLGFTAEQREAYYNAIKDLPPSLPGKRGQMLPVPVHEIGMKAVN